MYPGNPNGENHAAVLSFIAYLLIITYKDRIPDMTHWILDS